MAACVYVLLREADDFEGREATPVAAFRSPDSARLEAWRLRAAYAEREPRHYLDGLGWVPNAPAGWEYAPPDGDEPEQWRLLPPVPGADWTVAGVPLHA
jgi:hypothetical protein